MKLDCKYVIRIPAYPISKISNLNDIQSIVDDIQFVKAVYIASPSLYNALLKYKLNLLSEKENMRLRKSITRYYTRMCSRATPFGLFSAYTIGRWGKRNSIIIDDRRELNFDIDCRLLNKLITLVINKFHLKQNIKYYTNNHIFKTDDKIRYVEIDDLNENRGYTYSEADNNYIIEKILEKGKNGIIISDISSIIKQEGYDDADIMSFVDEVIDSKLLIPEWYLSVSNSKILDDIYSHIAKYCDPVVDLLKYYISYRKRDSNFDIESVISIAKRINTIKELNFDSDNCSPYNVTTKISPSNFELDFAIQNLILEGVNFLSKVTTEYINNRLYRFREKFINKYGERLVPLLEVVDPIVGIGYPTNVIRSVNKRIIDKLYIESNIDETISADFKIADLLLNKINSGCKEIILNDEDIKDFKCKNTFAKTMTVLTEVVYDSCNHSNLIYIKSVSGHTGTYSLSRFGMHDKDIQNILISISDLDKDNNKENEIEAEILHMPEGIGGNVVLRPITKEAVILCNANYNDESKQIINLSDLSIRYVNNNFQLVYAKTNQVIIPYNSTAHNYSISSYSAYVLLSDLQYTKFANSMFLDISLLLRVYNHIPRIRYRNCIFTLEMWYIDSKEIENLITSKESAIQNIKIWRNDKNIPRRVIYVDGDNTLLIDFEIFDSIKALISIAPQKKRLEIREFLYDSYSSVVEDKEGKMYSNEFTFTLINNS